MVLRRRLQVEGACGWWLRSAYGQRKSLISLRDIWISTRSSKEPNVADKCNRSDPRWYSAPVEADVEKENGSGQFADGNVVARSLTVRVLGGCLRKMRSTKAL